MSKAIVVSNIRVSKKLTVSVRFERLKAKNAPLPVGDCVVATVVDSSRLATAVVGQTEPILVYHDGARKRKPFTATLEKGAGDAFAAKTAAKAFQKAVRGFWS